MNSSVKYWEKCKKEYKDNQYGVNKRFRILKPVIYFLVICHKSLIRELSWVFYDDYFNNVVNAD